MEPDAGSGWRRIAPHKGDSGFWGFIPRPETTRVLALIDRGVTALLCLGGDRSERRHGARPKLRQQELGLLGRHRAAGGYWAVAEIMG